MLAINSINNYNSIDSFKDNFTDKDNYYRSFDITLDNPFHVFPKQLKDNNLLNYSEICILQLINLE